MSICKNCPSTKNGQCVCTDSCVIKKEQDRIAKFEVTPVFGDSFNPFQYGIGCVLSVINANKKVR